jgi:hypothetical protein
MLAFGDPVRSALGEYLDNPQKHMTARAFRCQGCLALDPNFSISRSRAGRRAWSDHPTYLAGLEPILDGLRMAGVPEQ